MDIGKQSLTSNRIIYLSGDQNDPFLGGKKIAYNLLQKD